jgi:DNA-binding FadR family transcriptional regulator
MEALNNQFEPSEVSARASDDTEYVARVRTYIDKRGLQPGDRLPAERQLFGELGMPRGALRRAFEALEREGLIWRHVGKGTFMSRAGAAIEESFDWTMGVARQITPLRMVRARLCIEPALAGEAALNASEVSLTRMRIALERACTATTWEEYEAQDDLFHRAIAEASDNLLLVGLFDQLNRVRRAVAFDVVTRDTSRPSAEHSSFKEHEDIAAAIEARDRHGAQNSMRKHLASVSKRLFED